MKFTPPTKMLLVGICCFAPSAHAYLDLGTGSMLLQALLGGIAGVVVVARLYWHKLLALFRKGKVEERDA
jgi:hypothetical protein